VTRVQNAKHITSDLKYILNHAILKLVTHIYSWQIISRGRDFFSFFNIKDIIKKRCAGKKISAS
jgi:hypothetical protein